MKEFFLKIIATSSRSLYALVCGLFISRWVVAALVKSEFGLYGVIGGMMVVVVLAYPMRLARGEIVSGMNVRQTYTVGGLIDHFAT